MYTDIDDTIVAASSGPGRGPRGIVRLSGPDALGVAGRLIGGASTLSRAPGFTHHRCTLQLDDDCAIDAIAYVFRAPKSYTRQDSVEFHTIGSPPVLEMIVGRCVALGARVAQPGEFTARSYLAGAMDLCQAEAVAAAIRARSDHQLRSARRMMRGEWAETVRVWRDELADLLSLVTADIDFAEEPIDFINPSELAARIGNLVVAVDSLLGAAPASRRSDSVPHVLLLGPPNAGKSTLLNRLSGVERAIASAVAGTTRDVLAVHVTFGEIEAILLDAAGIDDDPDEVLAAGRRRALEAASQVDLVCQVVDTSSASPDRQLAALRAQVDGPAIVVGSKVDLLDEQTTRQVVDRLQSSGAGPVCMVSAASGAGIEELRDAVRLQLISRDDAGEQAAIDLTTRQRSALDDARDALHRAAELATSAAATVDVAELIALELREALDALGGVWGEVTTEDLLGRVFATFCIGK